MRRRALVVVTGGYLHEQLADLESPLRAGKAAKRVLGSPDLGGFEVVTLANCDRSDIRRSIDDFFASAQPDDILFALFSGHGTVSNSKHYLMAVDTDPIRLTTAIPVDYLARQIGRCRARQIIILLDGTFGRAIPEMLLGPGDRILILTQGGTEAKYDDEFTFVDFFFDGMESVHSDRAKNGAMTVREAFDYALNRTRLAGIPQSPELLASTSGDVVLCAVPELLQPIQPKRRAFVSYVREDSVVVDRLAQGLRESGFDIWLDRTHLLPGMRWQSEIRSAIQAGDYFIACFSPRYTGKQVSYMNEELAIAIEQLRLMPRSRRWFIPVMLERCEIPALPIGPGETLENFHYADFSQDWDTAFESVIRSLSHE